MGWFCIGVGLAQLGFVTNRATLSSFYPNYLFSMTIITLFREHVSKSLLKLAFWESFLDMLLLATAWVFKRPCVA